MEAEERPIIAPDKLASDNISEMLEAEVLQVFDGDGFLARVWDPLRPRWIERVPVRLAFIDAPELQQPLGAEARDYLCRIIDGKKLKLDLIGKQSTGYMPIDQYKRLLCMAYLTEELHVGEIAYYFNGKHGVGTVRRPRLVTRNVELEMVANGWAWVTEQYAFDREEEYFAVQGDAQRLRRGLWAMDNPQPPWDFKRKQKRRASADGRQSSMF